MVFDGYGQKRSPLSASSPWLFTPFFDPTSFLDIIALPLHEIFSPGSVDKDTVLVDLKVVTWVLQDLSTA